MPQAARCQLLRQVGAANPIAINYPWLDEWDLRERSQPANTSGRVSGGDDAKNQNLYENTQSHAIQYFLNATLTRRHRELRLGRLI